MCGQSKIRIHAKSMERFKDKVRKLISRKWGKSLWLVIQGLNQYFRGWWNYFRFTEAKSFLKRAQDLDNAKTANSCLETMEKSQNQGS
ncbi:group II intron maturase-specific domain-containing protein [Desulfobacter hydrogenophilus]|nr:hypothetical protein [Desulfobacter hydrogenophilus]QBH15175.1 hypothetical protein EYB58_20985 [Desulfobacter hydrogenophilus]